MKVVKKEPKDNQRKATVKVLGKVDLKIFTAFSDSKINITVQIMKNIEKV